MTIPLIALAVLSVAGGFLGVPQSLGDLIHLPHSNLIERWLELAFVLPPEGKLFPHTIEYGLMVLSLAVAAIGCYVGYTLYSNRREIPERFSQKFPVLYRWVANKYYVDELYNTVFVKSLLRLNEFLARFDLKVVDGLVNLTAFLTKVTAFISGGFDRLFVDGAVNMVATLTQRGGAVLRQAQSGRIQVYLYYAAGGLLLVMLYRIF